MAPCSRASRGPSPRPQAEAAEALLRASEGLATEIVDDDDSLWDEQRAAQRGPLVVKVSGLPTRLPDLLRTADELGGVARGPRGPGSLVAALRGAVGRGGRAPAAGTGSPSVQDRPADLDVDPWSEIDPTAQRADAAREGALRSGRGVRVSGYDDTRAPAARPDRRLRALRLLPARPARPTCCGARRWTRRAVASC